MNCPNCNASQSYQVVRSVPNEYHCLLCYCIWFQPKVGSSKVLLTSSQIERIKKAEDEVPSYSPKKG